MNYLYLGKQVVVPDQSIVGIFDLENTSTSKKTREFLRINEKKGNTEYVGYEIPKTYILEKRKSGEKVVFTHISTQTLQKRAERTDSFGTEN